MFHLGFSLDPGVVVVAVEIIDARFLNVPLGVTCGESVGKGMEPEEALDPGLSDLGITK
jgi:hypothetical protein